MTQSPNRLPRHRSLPAPCRLLLLGLLWAAPASGQPASVTPPAQPGAASEEGSPASAPDAGLSSADALLHKIEALYAGSESMRARFEIETVNEAFGEVEVERGELFVTRPDRMKWQYSEPPGKVLLLDGQYQWMFLPEEGQAFRGEQTEASSELTLTLLADPGTLQRRFEVTAAPAPEGAAGAAAALSYLRLQPRRAEEDVKQVVLGVEPATGKVLSMSVVDGFDNTTKIRFSELELDPRLSSKVYELKLPKGTELLDLEGEPIKD